MTKKTLYFIFHIVFFLVFGLIFIGILLHNQSPFHYGNPFYQLIAMFVVLALWIGGYFFISRKKMTLRREILYVSLLFGVLLLLQLCCVHYLAVNPSWDFGCVYNGAYTIVTENPDTRALNYFKDYPINNFYLYTLTAVMKLASFFGIGNFRLVCVLFNVAMIDLAIVSLYFVVRKVWGSKLSVTSLFLCLFLSPFFGYVTIFYTDTLSMLFPILLLLCYVYLPKEKRLTKKTILLLLSMGLVALIGMKMKSTVIVIFIAILIHLFIQYDKKVWLKYIGVLLSSFIVFFAGYTLVDSQLTLLPFNHMKPGRMPTTHWVMMGLSKYPVERVPGRYWYGSFYMEDADYTYSLPTAKRAEENIRVTKERLKDYGFPGLMNFWYHKAVQTWGEGTYYFPEKVSRESLRERNLLTELTFPDGKYFSAYFYFNQGVQLALLFGILYATYQALRKREWDIDSIARVSMFGLAIVLTIWETRSRYLVNYIPIFLIASLPMIESSKKYWKRSK